MKKNGVKRGAARCPGISHSFEYAAMSAGFHAVAGVDEAGRGPLAGPVVAAAVILQPGAAALGVNDSKKLTQAKREELYDLVIEQAVSYRIVSLGADIVDEINIFQATMRAMKEAVEGLSVPADLVYIDGPKTPALSIPSVPIKSGDAKCFSIAAASILAKVSRDRRMIELDEIYPGYGLARHKGYGTKAHIEALRELGPTPEHRRTFAPVRALLSDDE